MDTISLHLKRLHGEEYALAHLFRPPEYDWPGDWEGRALLAFLCHLEMTGKTVPHLREFFEAIPAHTNEFGYFGPPFDGKTLREQQLSGHNWYLRGLLKYYELLGDERALALAQKTVEHLCLPALPFYGRYPLERKRKNGGVSGEATEVQNGWLLSTDTGCAFMCVDGLAHYYRITRDERVRMLLDGILGLFFSTDPLKYKLQTHTTLTCLRGILTLYGVTGEERLFLAVCDLFDLYQKHGMTLTYENFNWFGREDTWTEPCCVVDSLMLATELYRITKAPTYRTLARRILFCGLSFCHRENGGAGPNTCVTKRSPTLRVSMYEAPFCCTMRYAEGLLTYAQNRDLFQWDPEKPPVRDKVGRRFIDDRLLVKYKGEWVPLFSCRVLSREEAMEAVLTVLE